MVRRKHSKSSNVLYVLVITSMDPMVLSATVTLATSTVMSGQPGPAPQYVGYLRAVVI
jgi:hypothetical protein